MENLARSASTKPLLKTLNACKSKCYAITNLKLTSSHIHSLLSLNSYTSNSDIAGSVTLHRMLSKRTPLNHTVQEEVVFQSPFCLELALPRVGFSNQYFNKP